MSSVAPLLLLVYIGWGMVREGLYNAAELGQKGGLALQMLLVQGSVTSIDALSVGFAIAEYGTAMALTCSMIIAAVTFLLCVGGLWLGRRFGLHLAGRAHVLGGVILIFLGLEIFVTHLLR